MIDAHCAAELDSLGDDEMRLADECAAMLRSAMGGEPVQLEGFTEASWARALVDVLPDVRRLHREHDVPAEVSDATLAALGPAIREHRAKYGRAG